MFLQAMLMATFGAKFPFPFQKEAGALWPGPAKFLYPSTCNSLLKSRWQLQLVSESKTTITCPISALTRDSILAISGHVISFNMLIFTGMSHGKNIRPCRTDLIM